MSVNTRLHRPLAAAAMALAVIGSSLAAGTANAEPPVDPADLPVADAPMPVSEGEYSYLATHDLTVRAASMKVPDAVASLPVPAQYRPANLALAAQFDMALAGALKSPGGCLQIVVDPRAKSGNLFNYGFFPVAGTYCQ